MKRLAVGGFVLALAACGGGSSVGGTLTKAQYDAKVSHLCLVSADQFRELHLDNTVGDWKHYATSITHIDQGFATKLAALKPPASIATAAASYRTANAKAFQDDKDAIAAAKAGYAAKLRATIKQANKDTLAAWPYAKTIGATGCYIP